MRAGLFGPTHVRKGTPEYPDLTFEYIYADLELRLGSLRIVGEEFRVILRGIRMVLEARGL